MSILSRFYKKIIFKNFKNLKKINLYFRDIGSTARFNSLIREKSINLNYKFSFYSFSPHNPIIAHHNSINWILERYHAFFDYLDNKPVESLLEVGCGFGISTWLMKEGVKKKIVGLDKNKEAINVASKLFPDIEYKCDSFNNFLRKNPKAHFDLIVSSDVPLISSGAFADIKNKNIELILKHCDVYCSIGYKSKSFRETFFWKHKPKGRQLAFNTTLVGKNCKGISLKYFKYFFTWNYKESFIHSLLNKYYPPL